MSHFETAEGESSVTADCTDLEQRDVRALTEYMTVLPLGATCIGDDAERVRVPCGRP